ncbi:malonyl-CoA decarboxylase, mitochondrial isoform X2 [Impatiens glandulifera]|uniref:malonyl-CoA decarboxylase, mitochondrial isoform X2 n=1 Tax=Impatiens glandulifera TaxID=253017 RepID=UPI001FB0E838|nr:malonyl-CoA decarboxylase, mitochondrial isoform X2 [Impatiens glandulifera]
MNKKGLAILMRTRMRPFSPGSNKLNHLEHVPIQGSKVSHEDIDSSGNTMKRDFGAVRESMHSAISMKKAEVLDSALDEFSEGYLDLSKNDRQSLLLILAKDYDLDRSQIHELMKQYLGLEASATGGKVDASTNEDGSCLAAFYRLERNIRYALKPQYEDLFERLNTHPGGLKFLSIMRADILSILEEENVVSLRALESYMKQKLITWLSPAVLELHQITWDDPASLLEKIVAYEAVHPVSNLVDLKRRLGVGRRCFGYIHPAVPGEPLIFIEVALQKNVSQTIQEVLWDEPSMHECEATCALFYSISSTQPGLKGINLGKFLIKRVIDLVKKDMPNIYTFATLSPIPGYTQWLLAKLVSAERSDSTFRENILEPEEERALHDASKELTGEKDAMKVLWNLLTSRKYEWIKSDELVSVLEAPLMRLCARYLLLEKKRGRALDSVANFHLQNGAMIGRINWMADRSEKGLCQSAGIMVNYLYRLEDIEENGQSYISTGTVHATDDIHGFLPGEA